MAEPDLMFQAAVITALRDPQMQQQFTSIGLDTVGNRPEQFAAFRQQEFWSSRAASS